MSIYQAFALKTHVEQTQVKFDNPILQANRLKNG